MWYLENQVKNSFEERGRDLVCQMLPLLVGTKQQPLAVMQRESLVAQTRVAMGDGSLTVVDSMENQEECKHKGQV